MENNDKENEYIATAEGQQYLKGFNDGYLIAEHMPQVVKALADIKEKTPHVEGFLDGAKQYFLDVELNKEQEKYLDSPSKGPSRERGNEIDI
jgi:hypothetical protein